MIVPLLSVLLASSFSLDVAEDFVRDARGAYATPEYAAYTNSLIGTGRYAGLRLGRAKQERRPWREGTVRWISAPRADNVRDIGGWSGLRTGLVYRGSEFDASKYRGVADAKNPDKRAHDGLDLTDVGRRVFREEMHIRTDLDLRNPKYHTVLGEDVRHLVFPVGAYHNMLAKPGARQLVADCLRVFADESNYPIYVHCAGGCDRTGSIVFLLEGLCGVSETDLSIEYELTSFSGFGYRQRFDHGYYFASLVRLMKACPGATLAEQITWYARHELGLTETEIASIRRILVAPRNCSNDIVLEGGGRRVTFGLDGRLKPSGQPFVSVRLKDGRTFACEKLFDDHRGLLFFQFPEKLGTVTLEPECRPDGFAFHMRASSVKEMDALVFAETDFLSKTN